MFDFKKLKVIYGRDIYHFLLRLQESAFLKYTYQPEMNFTENKNLTDLLMLHPGLLHLTV